MVQASDLNQDEAGQSTTQEAPYPSSAYAWYCVFILFGIYINSFLDRQILSLLIPVISAERGYSDTALGFLAGTAFAIFYVIAGLPIGWLADRMSRRLLVGIGQVFWSIASIGFGVSSAFWHMVVARVGVGVGESTLSPSAYSIITDLFPPKKLGFALSVYGMGIYVGGGLAYLLGGAALAALGVGQGTTYTVPVFGELAAWQMVFFVIVLPTIPLSLLLFTLREPIRRGVAQARAAGGAKVQSAPDVGAFFRYWKDNWRSLAGHHVGFAFLSFSGYGAAAWVPTFFVRSYEWSPAFIGAALGWATIIMGPLGILFGGWLADRLFERGYTDARVRVGVISGVAWFPFGILFPLMPSGEAAYLIYFPAVFVAAMVWGVAPAAIQQIMPNQMRGQASAVYLFVINMIGLTLGPLVPALFTDYVFADPMMLYMSLLVVGALAHIVAVALLVTSLPSFRRSVEYLESWQQNGGNGPRLAG